MSKKIYELPTETLKTIATNIGTECTYELIDFAYQEEVDTSIALIKEIVDGKVTAITRFIQTEDGNVAVSRITMDDITFVKAVLIVRGTYTTVVYSYLFQGLPQVTTLESPQALRGKLSFDDKGEPVILDFCAVSHYDIAVNYRVVAYKILFRPGTSEPILFEAVSAASPTLGDIYLSDGEGHGKNGDSVSDTLRYDVSRALCTTHEKHFITNGFENTETMFGPDQVYCNVGLDYSVSPPIEKTTICNAKNVYGYNVIACRNDTVLLYSHTTGSCGSMTLSSFKEQLFGGSPSGIRPSFSMNGQPIIGQKELYCLRPCGNLINMVTMEEIYLSNGKDFSILATADGGILVVPTDKPTKKISTGAMLSKLMNKEKNNELH